MMRLGRVPVHIKQYVINHAVCHGELNGQHMLNIGVVHLTPLRRTLHTSTFKKLSARVFLSVNYSERQAIRISGKKS